jgi:hypothetical protein
VAFDDTKGKTSDGKVDYTLFSRKVEKKLLICQIYVGDIIFGSTNQSCCDEFRKNRFKV